MGPLYATREDVLDALDAAETARSAAQVDRLIDAASRSVEALTRRTFHPQRDTRYFTWPNDQMGKSWRLWLDANELLTVITLVTGDMTITDYFLEPQAYGPPYSHIEMDLASSGAFSAGRTFQRAIAITGVFGYGNDTRPGGQLASSPTAGSTTVDVADGSLVGVGDMLLLGDEYVQVTARTMLTTGQTLQSPVGAQKNETALAVTDGTAFHVGERLLLDGERMQIVDIAGNTLVVARAQEGSVLAAHTAPTVYAARTLTVARAQLGTTAASHTAGSAVLVHDVPGPVRSLVIAESLAALQAEQGAYAAGVGRADRKVPGSTNPLEALRAAVKSSHGRQARIRVA